MSGMLDVGFFIVAISMSVINYTQDGVSYEELVCFWDCPRCGYWCWYSASAKH